MDRTTALSWCLALAASIYLAVRLAPIVDDLHAVGDYDTAEYYAVARNLARGDGLTDPVRWHHLGDSPHVVRPAGDYHSAFWPLVLGTFMAVFGHSQRVALWIVFALGLLLPPLLFFLARRLDPRSQWVAPTFAAVVVASLGRLHPTLVSPDITLAYQLSTMGGLFAWMTLGDSPRARVLAGFLLASPLYFRGEGFVGVAAVLPVMLFAKETWRVRSKRIGAVLAGAAIVWLSIGLYSLVAVGDFTPKPRSATLVMTSYADIFAMTTEPSFDTWWAQGAAQLWSVRATTLAQHLDAIYTQLPLGLMVLAGVGTVIALVRRNGRAIAVALFVVLTVVVPIALVPIVASRDRVALNVAPPLVVLAGVALAELDARIPKRFVAWAPAAALGLVCVAWHAPFAWHPSGKLRSFVQFSRPAIYDTIAQHVPAGSVVIAEDPWHAAIHLDVGAAHIPGDGRAGIVRAIEVYEPDFVLTIVNTPRDRIVAGLKDRVAGRTTVGHIIVNRLKPQVPGSGRKP